MSTKILGCSVLLLLFLITGLGLAFFLFGEYNALVRDDEAVSAQWSQVENVYQRRADLIPNLVETVKGASEFEQETLTAVVEARAKVGQMNVDAGDVVNNPDAFAQFQATQDELTGALQRLMVVVERYPELRSVQAYQDLMNQLEGTENRISVERRRYNDVAREFNTRLKKVPTRWFVSLLGWEFEEKSYFTATEGADEVPRVEF